MAPRAKPPAVAPLLNWAAPWLDQIAFLCFCNEGGGSVTELITGRPMTASVAAAQKTTTIYGRAAQYDGTYFNELAINPFTTPAGTQAGDFTLLILANPQLTGFGSAFIGCEDNPATSGVVVYANMQNFAVVNGYLQVSTFHAGAGETLSIAGLVDGGYHVFVVRRLAGTTSVFVDGVVKGTVASITDISIPSGRLGLGGVSNQGRFSGNIPFAAGWNRGLADAEVATFSNQLWDLLLADDWDVMLATGPQQFVGWGALVDPVRRAWRPEGGPTVQAPLIAPPNPLTTFPQWYSPLADPVRRKVPAPADWAAWPPTYVANINPDFGFAKWFVPLADPVRRRVPAPEGGLIAGNPNYAQAPTTPATNCWTGPAPVVSVWTDVTKAINTCS